MTWQELCAQHPDPRGCAQALKVLDDRLRAFPGRDLGNLWVIEESLMYLRICSSFDLASVLEIVNELYPVPDTCWELALSPLPGSGDPAINGCGDGELKHHYALTFPDGFAVQRLEQIQAAMEANIEATKTGGHR